MQNRLDGTGSNRKSSRLIVFCRLLLKTCEYDATPVFQKLLDEFRADLSVDDALFGVSDSRHDLI